MKNEAMEDSTDLSNASFRHNWPNQDKGTVDIVPALTRRHRILCVDDEIMGMKLRGQLLEKTGYSVVLCHCPLEALRYDLSMFSLAIVDFEMPELNGRELFLRMRASGARFPIVLLAGFIDGLLYEDRVLFARCIDKGRSVQCLLDTIAEFLGSDQIPDFGTNRKRSQGTL